MGQIELLAIDFCGEGLFVQNQSALLCEVIVAPDIVVACEEMHLHTHIRQLRQLAQEAGIALGYHRLELIPEVEHIAHQVDGIGLELNLFQEIHQSAFLCAAMLYGQ